MANTSYVLLEKITVGAAGASSVTFSGIPQTGYTDLVVKMSARSTSGYAGENVDDMKLNFNNNTSAVYTRRNIEGNGSAAGSANTVNSTFLYTGTCPDNNATANTFGNYEVYIPNYTSSNNKSMSIDVVTENNATKAYAQLQAGIWANTSAINRIDFALYNGFFVANSTFYLYGVAALGTTPAIVPYATGGDTIMTDGTYWYHAFKASGTFTPTKALSCDVLVVAGGGGGGWSRGGGGGAGGLLGFTAQSLITSGYTVTVGGGGAGATGGGAIGSQGSNSQFGSLTATVGGGGGDNSNISTGGGSGGSGGGGCFPNYVGGSGTSGQGNAGGAGSASLSGAGGGGGASAAGSAGSVGGGNGGAGVNTYSSWLSVVGLGVSGYVAGGGGGGTDAAVSSSGGTGGAGGGANGSYNTTVPSNAIANTGGGGGGGGRTTSPSAEGSGSNGGSGLIVVRYLV